uniref:DDE_3 domain-containing protein n=1 Tax=Caenorhabditis japonica TaxID=281687 RepID=A0A8R1E769_CAEJA
MAIIRGRQMGLDMPTLAKQFKTSKSVIWATLNTPNRYKATGRPLKTSSGDERITVRMRKKNPRLTSTDINSELKDQSGVQKAPSKKANDSGEEPFSSTEVGKGSWALDTSAVEYVDKRYDPKYQVPTVKHGGSNVMMWGCFHATGVGSLIRITGTMESYQYKNIMGKEILPSGRFQIGRRWLFQQDNNPEHSSHFVKDWFAQRRVNVMTWPSQSPDLNPFEHLWEVLGIRLKNKTAKNCTEKFKQLKEEWTKIPLQTMTNLIESM